MKGWKVYLVALAVGVFKLRLMEQNANVNWVPNGNFRKKKKFEKFSTAFSESIIQPPLYTLNEQHETNKSLHPSAPSISGWAVNRRPKMHKLKSLLAKLIGFKIVNPRLTPAPAIRFGIGYILSTGSTPHEFKLNFNFGQLPKIQFVPFN